MSPHSSHNPVRVSLKELSALKEKARFLKAFSTKKPVHHQTGETRSLFKTRGLDFQELRPYQPGDDLRQIDWRATAKYGKPFTKLYTEEKERPVFFLCDLRSRMKFASRGDFKSVMAARMTALLAWVSLQKKDPIGYALLQPHVITTSAPTKGENAVLELLKALEQCSSPDTETEDETTLAQALELVQLHVKRGAFIFVFSDFEDLTSPAVRILTQLADKQTVALIRLYDMLEKELPEGLLPISDGKTSAYLNMSSHNRHVFTQEFEQNTQRLKQLAETHGLGFLSFATTDAYLNILMKICEAGGVS